MTIRDRLGDVLFEVSLQPQWILAGPHPDALYNLPMAHDVVEIVDATNEERAALRRAGFDLAKLERPGRVRIRRRARRSTRRRRPAPSKRRGRLVVGR